MLNIAHLVLYTSFFMTYRALASSVPRDYGEIKLFESPVTYDLNTSVSLNDDKREVGYTLRAALRVEAAGGDRDDDLLLKFHLSAPALSVRGRAQRAPWRSSDSEFFARWSRGRVRTVYLDPSDPPDELNYKIAIISLFQFQVLEGEVVETDVSGSCRVSYETVSGTDVRKTKSACGPESAADELDAEVVALYSLQPSLNGLRSVRLVERLQLDRSLSVRVDVSLEARGRGAAVGGAGARRAALGEAVRALPAALTERRLEPAEDGAPAGDRASLEEALTESGAALAAEEEEAGGGGRGPAARAALRLLPALRAASPSTLLAALRAPGAAGLPALCRLLGLAGTAAAHGAVDEFLELSASEPPAELAAQYLAGAALAPQPQPAAVRALLRLAGEARNAHVSAHALLSAAGAAPRAADPAVVDAVRDAALKGLARCKEDECRSVRLTALGNLRDRRGADVLVEHAERGARTSALAALDGLAGLPPAALRDHPARRARLEGLALRGGQPLEVRAAALDLLLRRAAADHLSRLAAGLRAAPGELRRLLWQRVDQLAASDDAVRAALRSLPAVDRSLWARAAQGTSAVLTRHTGWTAGGRAAQLDAVQVAAGGLLRRATVTLLAGDTAPAGDATGLELEVSVWTRGLEGVAGGADEQRAALDEGPLGEGPHPVSGGLALAVGGVRGPGITLFAGQAELLSHVWAGTGSTPTPVLRAVRVVRTRAGRRRLAAGAALEWRRGAAAALALDAQAQVSLWSRNARLALQLRTATHDDAGLELRVPGGGDVLRAHALEDAEPTVDIVADLDFYEEMALCVRVHLADHHRRRNDTLSWAGAGGGGRRRRVASTRAVGRTLALGRPNDRTCRTLGAPDPAR